VKASKRNRETIRSSPAMKEEPVKRGKKEREPGFWGRKKTEQPSKKPELLADRPARG